MDQSKFIAAFESALINVTQGQVDAYADALVALRLEQGLTREQALALTLGYVTSEAHELGATEAEYRLLVDECAEEEWSTPNTEGLKAHEAAPAIESEQDLRRIVGLLAPVVPPTQGWMVFVFNYGEDANDGKRAAYAGSVERPVAATILEAVLDFWKVRDEQLIEPNHHTVGLLRMMVEHITESETAGVERHPNQRTPHGQDAATVHLEAAAQHLAVYRQLTLQVIQQSKARARREAH